MRTYVTVAIPYVNAEPHLGYAYELVEADAYARARRLAGDEVRFLGGTDDYSLKNVLAAEAAGVETSRFVAGHAASFEALGATLALSFDDFIRTSTDRRHAPAVRRLWQACAKRGDLYLRPYEGDYCTGCERFYSPDELVRGCCPEHGTPPERVAEENWFFRLSAYEDRVAALIESGELAICPETFREEVLSFVRGGLSDISVSRSIRRSRGWGIGVPGDDSQVVYVWFDALANYVSALGFGDPASLDYRRWWRESDRRVHLIGKGILRFHAVYWPAFLASAGEPAPTRIQVHPYLTAGGAKLSKSAGNGVDPVTVVADVGRDALRWWFSRDVAAATDTDFTMERLRARANEDLANGLGNVTNRIVTLVHRLCGGSVPAADARPLDDVRHLREAVLEALAEFDLRTSVRLINEAVAALNRHLEATKPWQAATHARAAQVGPIGRTGYASRSGEVGPSAEELRRSEEGQLAMSVLLAGCVRTARIIAGAAEPIVPDLSGRLLDQLGRSDRLPHPVPVFKRIEQHRDAGKDVS